MFISKYFNITWKPAFALFGEDEKAIWRNVWSIWNETISLVTLGSKELWLDEKNHTTVKPDLTTASRRMKTYIENRTELRNLQILKKCWKKQVSFCYRSSPVSRKALTLHWKLQELKKYPWKTCGCSQPRGHLIRVLNERIINDGGDFVFCGWWFSNQFDIVSKTHLSCDTVGHKLWLAILSSLLCPEMDRDICIGKQGCVYFIWF